ncbi:MAG: hypothetical protein J2P29_09180 [Actinobacteria bacterium]|nr:hypothetical protein [Actinomycetota bacterium]
MRSGDGRWGALSSEHERIIKPDEPVRPTWSELASNRERLVHASDPLFPATTGSHRTADLRLVASAA